MLGHIEQCQGDIKDIHQHQENSKDATDVRKISRDPIFFSFGRWWMMWMPRKCNEDVGQR
jgi:hypothetical protein